jgi:hypothetical protein
MAHVAKRHRRAGGVLGLHSITSSARASSEGGTVRLSAFAVFRLITNSIFVGARPADRPASPQQNPVDELGGARGPLSR